MIITQKAMADASDSLSALFEGKKYTKIENRIKQNGGIKNLIGERETIEIYIKTLFILEKPRKIEFLVKEILDSGNNYDLIMNIIKMMIKSGNTNGLKRIGNKITDEDELTFKMNLEIIEARIGRRYSPENDNFELMGDFLKDLLNNKNIISLSNFKDWEERIITRFNKMYREGSHENLVSLLQNVVVSDYNFMIYRFLILSKIKLNRDEAKILCIDTINILKIPKNIEIVLDYFYTLGEFEEIISIIESDNDNNFSFRSKIIYSRAMNRIGQSDTSLRIKREAIADLWIKLEENDIDIEVLIESIGEINVSGDSETAENMLYVALNDNKMVSELDSKQLGKKIGNLFKEIIDNKKRNNLRQSLDYAKVLIQDSENQAALKVILPYINHGIRTSGELFEIYIILLSRLSEYDKLNQFLLKESSNFPLTTIERIVETLENEGLFEQHFKLIESVPVNILNSKKIIRSFFKVREQRLQRYDLIELIQKICKIKKPNPDIIVYLSEQITVFIKTPHDYLPYFDSIRIPELKRIICRLKIINKSDILIDIKNDLSSVEKIINSKKYNYKDLSEVIDLLFTYLLRQEEYDTIEKVSEIYESMEKLNKNQVTIKIRSLTAQGKTELVRKYIEEYSEKFGDIERWRMLIQIGDIEEVKLESAEVMLDNRNNKQYYNINFSLGNFNSYLESIEDKIKSGLFDLQELTRYFYALCKIGEEEKCQKEYLILRRRYSWDAKKRAIMAIVGYDFSFTEDYINELDLCYEMNKNDKSVPIMIIRAFINLERIDIAYRYYHMYISTCQQSNEFLQIGKKLGEMIQSFDIDPRDLLVNDFQNNPVYTDVEVIRSILQLIPEKKVKKMNTKNMNIGIQSHTLDIGGAERQVSYVLNFLSDGKIRNEKFSLITNSVPVEINNSNTYYKNLNMESLEIYEYNKPLKKATISIDDEISVKLSFLSKLKSQRIKKMIEIYSENNFDIVHTWQDWCNIYGGFAAIISGTKKIIMSARTLSPPKKSILQSRSGRSYKECYLAILNRKNVILTHNSKFGLEDYSKWLEISNDDKRFKVMYNGLGGDFVNYKKTNSKLRKELGIKKNDIVIGTVGRMTTDKRPWMFLKIVEAFIRSDKEEYISEELKEWYLNKEQNIEIWNDKENRISLGEDLDKAQIKFIMVGDGPQFERVSRIVKENNKLTDKIILIGHTSDVRKYLEIMDCFVLTSKVEGLPNVIIEAQYSGIPVISTDAGGARECIIENTTGLICEIGNEYQIPKMVLNTIKDQEIINNSKKKAPKFILEKFGEKNWAKSINKLYSEALK